MGIRPAVARRPGVFLTILLALLALLAAYWWWGPLPGDDRLLAVSAGMAKTGAPPRDTWTMTIGGVLCTDGAPVTIDAVDTETSGDVDVIGVQVLTMQPADIRASGFSSIIAVRGTPPDFTEEYADSDAVPGAYTDAVGTEVTEPCRSSRQPDDFESQSLLVLTRVGPQGGRLDDVRVTYSSWGRAQTTTDWQGSTVLCGVEQTTRGCPGMAVDEQGRSVTR